MSFIFSTDLDGASNPGNTASNKENIHGPSHGEYTTLDKSDTSGINTEYQSLKKPGQEFGSPDYMDPEKYTEPPNLKPTSSRDVVDDDDKDGEDDYVGKDGPGVVPGKKRKDNNPSGTSSKDYVNVDSQEASNVDDDREYFTLEPPVASGQSGRVQDDSEQKNSDYIDVDDPSLSKEQKSKSGSDYVDVDDPSLSQTLESKQSSDYVDVDN